MKATGKTCGGNDGCGKPKRQGFPQPWKSLRDSHIPTARLLLYIFPKPIPKGVFLTACTFSLQAHSSIRKDSNPGSQRRSSSSFPREIRQDDYADERAVERRSPAAGRARFRPVLTHLWRTQRMDVAPCSASCPGESRRKARRSRWTRRHLGL